MNEVSPDFRQMAAFQESARSRFALLARRRYDGRRKRWPAGSARVKWEISAVLLPGNGSTIELDNSVLSGTHTPEPGTLTLLALGGLGL